MNSAILSGACASVVPQFEIQLLLIRISASGRSRQDRKLLTVGTLRAPCVKSEHDVGRPGSEVAAALAAQGIYISKQRGNMVNWVRISFGTPAEMRVFKAAFEKIMTS